MKLIHFPFKKVDFAEDYDKTSIEKQEKTHNMKLFKENKKEYSSPHIKCIPLIAEQAILLVCNIGGAYFGWESQPGSTKCTGIANIISGSGFCQSDIRGQSYAVGGASIPVSYENKGS